MNATSWSAPIRIGTRASLLALAQAEMVKAALQARFEGIEVTLHRFTTAGDQLPNAPLERWGYKGLFTKEIETALLENQVDLAVHSMKDMPSLLPDGLTVAGMLPREDPRDALLCAAYDRLEALPQGARFGTSSLRRAAQIKRLRPDLALVPFRGNVPTRIDKIARGEADASLIAYAGLKRLGQEAHAAELFSTQIILPAVAQGAIGIEVRERDEDLRAMIESISHADTVRSVSAEREMLRVLDGSCQTPIAGYAELSEGHITLRGLLLAPDGTKAFEATQHGAADDAIAIGHEAGQTLLAQAGPDFLQRMTHEPR